MMKKYFLYLLFFLLVNISFTYADVKLPRLISDGMVLQRGGSIKIWGWADPGEKITLSFNKQAYKAATDASGIWTILLPAFSPGGPFHMDIQGRNYISIRNILIGDVWICSGQSNMELPMERVKEKYANTIKNSLNPNIRQFNMKTTYNFNGQQNDLESGNWIGADPKSVLDFSAAGYFFAKDLYEKYHVPIGLIKSSVGGSPAEAWLSEEALHRYPDYLAITQKYKNNLLVDSIKKKDQDVINSWNQLIDKNDLGLNGLKKWFDPIYDASAWDNTQVPGFWDKSMLFKFNHEEQHGATSGHKDLQEVNGVVWFRKEIEIPASMTGKSAKLLLGRIVDRDEVYVNGRFAGTTGYQYPPRRYELPPGLLKEGKNIIVVRVVNNTGRGGFVKDKLYQLSAGNETIDLKGLWQYKLGYASEPMPGGETTFQYQPAGLFNAMISPLLNYRIKGVIWYQGESNTGRAKEYSGLFRGIIEDWRKHWKQGDFPFIYVQLANFMEPKSSPSESNWAELRDAQLKTLSVLNTGMAVTIDIGEWNDIHPLDKEDVGKRLALAAQKVAYGIENIVYSGPIYQSMRIEKKRIILSFTNTGSGLMAKGSGELKYFAISGPDKKFVWAKAIIKGNKVEVWNDAIPDPVAVRYGWADNPEGANLYNKENLPASPFKTD